MRLLLVVAWLLAQETQAEAAEARNLQKALAAHAGDVHGCYARALAPDRGAGGELLVRVTMGGNNSVARAEILKDEVGSPLLTGCLRERMLAWNLPGVGAAGTQVVFPLVFKAGPEQRSVRLADVEPVPKTPPPAPGKHARQPPLQTWLLLDEQSVAASRASLAVVALAPKSKIAMHRHPQSAELLYVIDGHGRLLIPGAAPQKLEAGTAVLLAAGTPHSIDDQSAQKSLRMVQVFAPPGPEKVLRDRTKSAGTEVVRGAAPAPQTGGYKVVREADVKPIPIAGAKAKVTMLLDPQGTADARAYLGILEGQAGAEVPRHKHDGSAELVFGLDGKARLSLGGEDIAIEPDTAVYVPEGAEHSGTFSAPARVLQVYAPPGPEQRFRQPGGTGTGTGVEPVKK